MTAPQPRWRVFLSHTSELRAHPTGRSFIDAAEEAIAAAGHVVVDMKHFPAGDTPPALVDRDMVESADVYVLVAGFRYGTLVPDLHPPVSYTEHEYDTATALGMPRLVFLLGEDTTGPPALFVDHDHGARQVAFRQKVSSGRIRAEISTPDALKDHLGRALAALPPPRQNAAVGGGRLVGRVWNIPARIGEFTGRDDVLTTLAATLTGGGPAVVHAVTGTGGVGKTSTAIEYAHRHADQFDIAWWVPAENPDLVPDRLAALAHALSLADVTAPTAEAVARLHAHLHQRDRWLLVFDNAEAPDTFQDFFPAGPGQVLITSRNPHWRGVATPVPLRDFVRRESVALLRELVPGLADADADRVADAVGDLPLALDQAGALLASGGGFTVATYLEALQRQAGAIYQLPARSRPVAAAWAVAFDALHDADPIAADLLTLLAWLAPEPVPISLLFTPVDGRTLDTVPAALRVLIDNPVAVVAATDQLIRRGLVRADPAGVVLHRAPAALLRDRPTDAGTPDWPTVTARLLRAVLPVDVSDNPAVWPTWQQLLPHVLATTHPDRNLDTVPRVVWWLLNMAAGYRLTRGEPLPALPLLERAYQLARDHFGDDHPDTLISAGSLAADLWTLGHHDQARTLDQNNLTRRRRTLGDDHLDTLRSANNLANNLTALGHHDQARTLHEDTLTRSRRTLGDNHPQTLASAHSLANNLSTLGHHDQARTLHEDTLTRSRRTLGDNHRDTLNSARWLANVLDELGEHEQASRWRAWAKRDIPPTEQPHH